MGRVGFDGAGMTSHNRKLSHAERQQQVALAVSAIGAQFPVVRDHVECAEFEFPTGELSTIAIAQHRADPRVAVVSSLGCLSVNCFVMVVDDAVPVFAKSIATVEFHDASVKALHSQNFIELPDSEMAGQLGWVGLQLLPIEADGATRGFPDQLVTRAGAHRLIWMVPLSAAELELRKTAGLEALLDRFIETQRDPIAVAPLKTDS